MVKEKKDVKRTAIANFNVVFLEEKDEEKPLLEYFGEIVMPAFTSGITRKTGDATYLVMDAKVILDKDEEYVLTGLIVKSTTLEIKSQFDEKGELISLDNVYPTAPFSTFAIYLKNHRMVLVQNQKGSPTIDNFRSTVKHIMTQYVQTKNRERDENEALPIPLVSVVGIPPRGGISGALKDVEKIKTLTLRFFPLNGDGDISFSKTSHAMLHEYRKLVGAKTGSVNYNSPKDMIGVEKLIEASEGTVEPVIVAKYPNEAGEKTIKNDEVSERRTMTIPEASKEVEIKSIVNQGKDFDNIQFVSQENEKIYRNNERKIIPFVKKE